MTDENQVKLADVGVAKHERDISGTFCGTLLYLAPEVLDGQLHDSKSDMYSFGIILWEMWYAMTAFHVELASRSQFQLLNDVRGGLRPSHINDTRQPWGMWQLIMEKCWDKEPQHRFTAQQSRDALDRLQKEKDMATASSPPHSPPEATLQKSPGRELPDAESSDPPFKLRPAPRPTTPQRVSVSFSAKTQDANVHFD